VEEDFRLTSQPLAFRVRPKSLDEFVGQKKILAQDSPLMIALRSGRLPSLILYGPPGCGKTTLAHIIANEVKADFYQLSAVDSGVKDVRKVIEKAEDNFEKGKKTILFIDEIHRFNKAQQDALLPAVESGKLVLIGATTENPFFEIIRPLLSRCLLMVMEPLSNDDIKEIVLRSLVHEQGLKGKFQLEKEALSYLVQQSGGDARRALNILESAAEIAGCDRRSIIGIDDIKKVLQTTVFLYDKGADLHYDFISALIKSLRASDPDASLAYLVRMIEGGEDPKFIARRLIIFASEDIGNADPLALLIAVAAFEAVEKVGLPECIINLSQAVTYLATAPKSNASYVAYKKAAEDARQIPKITIPLKLRDSHYSGAQVLAHGSGYRYPHDYPGHFYPESLMPEELKGKIYYQPGEQGFEKKIKQRLDEWRKLIKKKGSD